MIYVSLLSFLQDFGLNTLIFFHPNICLRCDINSWNPGPINILITNFPSGLRRFWYIQRVCSMSTSDLMASRSLTPVVFGAMSDWIKSTCSSLCCTRMAFTASWSVISCWYVDTPGRLSSTGLRSNPIIWGFLIWNFCIWETEYWSQLPGAQPISIIAFVFLSITWNLSWISSNLKALRALYQTFLACLK